MTVASGSAVDSNVAHNVAIAYARARLAQALGWYCTATHATIVHKNHYSSDVLFALRG